MAPPAYCATEVETLLTDYKIDEFLLMINEEKLFVAISGNNIVGTAGWHERNIRRAYVGPDAFERGIGTLLTKHAQADYRTRTGHGATDAGVILYARGFY